MLLLVAGCTPASFIARKAVLAPNRAPDLVKPEARLMLRWPADLMDRFPSGTSVVGDPPVPLRWVRVDPAHYGMSLSSAVRRVGRKVQADIALSFDSTLDGTPLAEKPRGTLFLVHGYGVDLETLLPWAMYLGEAGWRSVLVDLRGHGGSGGKRVTFGPAETNDLCELRVQLEREGVVTAPVGALGHSLGGALVLRWAAVDPEVRGVVAIGAPASFEASMVRVRDEYARWLPRLWVRQAARRVPGVLGVSPDALDTWAALRGHPVRAFLVAGASDHVTPPEESAQLREFLADGSEFLVVNGVSHETLPYWFEEHGPKVLAWLSQWVAEPRGSGARSRVEPGVGQHVETNEPRG